MNHFHSPKVYCCCSVAKSCPIVCNPMNCRTLCFPVLHCLPNFAKTHVHWAIQPPLSHPLSPPSPPALSLSQHQGLFWWVGSSHWVAKILKLQHQSFQWIFRLISYRIGWFDLLAYKGLSKAFSSTTIQSISSLAPNLLYNPTLVMYICTWLMEKP